MSAGVVRETVSPTASRVEPPKPAATEGEGRRAYLAALGCAFALFNSVRVFAYLPNIWSIVQQGESSQHSLLTWLVLLGANTTMAAWLYEENEQTLTKTVAVNVGNAAMCLLTAAVIAYQRC